MEVGRLGRRLYSPDHPDDTEEGLPQHGGPDTPEEGDMQVGHRVSSGCDEPEVVATSQRWVRSVVVIPTIVGLLVVGLSAAPKLRRGRELVVVLSVQGRWCGGGANRSSC